MERLTDDEKDIVFAVLRIAKYEAEKRMSEILTEYLQEGKFACKVAIKYKTKVDTLETILTKLGFYEKKE